ncbi:hypothetical protein BGS_0314 [Beggiatoa sp. SS]|nr:hypothetical protein BGS_0314 [Beggiatoa sp. SS]
MFFNPDFKGPSKRYQSPQIFKNCLSNAEGAVNVIRLILYQ